MPMTQLTDHLKLNKKEGPSVDTSISLRRWNKIITGSKGRKGPGWEKGGREMGGEGGSEGSQLVFLTEEPSL